MIDVRRRGEGSTVNVKKKRRSVKTAQTDKNAPRTEKGDARKRNENEHTKKNITKITGSYFFCFAHIVIFAVSKSLEMSEKFLRRVLTCLAKIPTAITRFIKLTQTPSICFSLSRLVTMKRVTSREL